MVKTGTRILKSIYSNGRTRTKTISEEVGIKLSSIHTCCDALRSRGLIKKETVREKRQLGKNIVSARVSYWWIRPNKIDRVRGMLKEAYGD